MSIGGDLMSLSLSFSFSFSFSFSRLFFFFFRSFFSNKVNDGGKGAFSRGVSMGGGIFLPSTTPGQDKMNYIDSLRKYISKPNKHVL